MKIGQRLGRALERAGLSQRDVADRAKMDETAVSKIITGKTASPFFITVEKIVRAAGLTWGELFDEPQMRLSETDARAAREFRDVLDRVLDNDARQKRIGRSQLSVVHDAPRGEYDEVEELRDDPIPEEYQRVHANRVYRVRTDAMQILEGSLLFARATQNEEAADGETVVCRLNGKLYLRRLDRRGGRTMLEATNPRYAPIRVDRKNDRFSLVAIVCTLDA
ncbi:MAG TPA: S24 family peptidase [Thermoanaerobaculia bacterium]|nr:S24 family peptidase [Thermoanaerobaculia bacterium]